MPGVGRRADFIKGQVCKIGGGVDVIICNFIKGQGLLKMPDGTYKGKIMHVEWHSYCGPMLMIKDWQRDCKRQPKENSRYWDLMKQWYAGGLKINDSGYLLNRDGDLIK